MREQSVQNILAPVIDNRNSTPEIMGLYAASCEEGQWQSSLFIWWRHRGMWYYWQCFSHPPLNVEHSKTESSHMWGHGGDKHSRLQLLHFAPGQRFGWVYHWHPLRRLLKEYSRNLDWERIKKGILVLLVQQQHVSWATHVFRLVSEMMLASTSRKCLLLKAIVLKLVGLRSPLHF